MGEYKDLFEFAAKAGALEGYLYEREEVESLDNWVSNIEQMYANLPDNMKDDIKNELRNVLRKILNYGSNVVAEDITTKLNKLLLAL